MGLQLTRQMQRPVDVKPVTNMVTGYEETPINESRRQKLRNGTCCVRAEKARAGLKWCVFVRWVLKRLFGPSR